METLTSLNPDESEITDDSKILENSEPTENTNDPDLEAIKARVREMEEEAQKIKQMHDEVEKQIELNTNNEYGTRSLSLEEKIEIDNRSVFVGNVDYTATADDLETHFHGCGSVNRVTILCDKFSGHPKGFAFIEFAERDSVQTAMALDESLFKGRIIKVNPKRTNRPGISTTNRGRGRGIRWRGQQIGRPLTWANNIRPTRRALSSRGRGTWFFSPY